MSGVEIYQHCRLTKLPGAGDGRRCTHMDRSGIHMGYPDIEYMYPDLELGKLIVLMSGLCTD